MKIKKLTDNRSSMNYISWHKTQNNLETNPDMLSLITKYHNDLRQFWWEIWQKKEVMYEANIGILASGTKKYTENNKTIENYNSYKHAKMYFF